jgi:hypothetical protein
LLDVAADPSSQPAADAALDALLAAASAPSTAGPQPLGAAAAWAALCCAADVLVTQDPAATEQQQPQPRSVARWLAGSGKACSSLVAAAAKKPKAAQPDAVMALYLTLKVGEALGSLSPPHTHAHA